jgi:hypothetical protein
MTDETLSPQQAVQQQDAIIAGKPWNQLSGQEAQLLYALDQVIRGKEGAEVLATMGAETVPTAAIQPPQPGSASVVYQSVPMALESFVQHGFDPESARELNELEMRQPPGVYTEEHAIHGMDPIRRSNARELFAKGYARLHASAQGHLESRTTRYASDVYLKICALGEEVMGLDAEIEAVSQQRPIDMAKLRALLEQRDGPHGSGIVAF